MENILLVFLNELENISEYQKIINKFDENNYKIYVMEEIKEDPDFSPDQLPWYVQSYKNCFSEINDIAVLSNSRDLLLSWYRCYNSLVNNFIYFIDKDNKEYFDNDNRYHDFYNRLYNFNQIEYDKVEGKIFTNLNINNYKQSIYFIVKNRNNNYFILFDNYKFIFSQKPKKIISKKYEFRGFDYSFDIEESKSSHKVRFIEDD